MSQTTDSAQEAAKPAAQAHTPSATASVLVPSPEKRRLTPTLLRRGIQGAFAVFLVWVGWNFYLHVQWATGKSLTFTPKPPSVEGFLPISELMAARRLFETGMWDVVHPAGLTLFLAIALMALLFRKGFCGYICPVGLASNLLGRLGERLGLNRNPPRKLELALQAIKYVPVGVIVLFQPVRHERGRNRRLHGRALQYGGRLKHAVFLFAGFSHHADCGGRDCGRLAGGSQCVVSLPLPIRRVSGYSGTGEPGRGAPQCRCLHKLPPLPARLPLGHCRAP